MEQVNDLLLEISVGISLVVQWLTLRFQRRGHGLEHDHGIESKSPKSPALAGGLFTASATWEASVYIEKGKERKVAQSCPTLCHPMDCSLPSSSVHGIFQAIVQEWIAISFSRGSS